MEFRPVNRLVASNSLLHKMLISGGGTHLLIQLFRYLIVGGVAFIVDFGLLAFLTEKFELPYQLSACISFVAGLTVNYVLSIFWVFNSQAQGRSAKVAEFTLFAIVGVVGLGLNALIMWLFTEKAGFHYLLSKIVSTIIVFAWNFFARRSIIANIQTFLWTTLKMTDGRRPS